MTKCQHELACLKNPMNQCEFCGQGFSSTSGFFTLTLQKHVGQCPSNPINQCKYCHAGFSNTFRQSSQMCKIQHEAACRSNPENHARCEYCKEQHVTKQLNAEVWLRRHTADCKDNPTNWCRFCKERFGCSWLHAASIRKDEHEDDCKQNPKNRCERCGKVLGKTGRPQKVL